MKQPKEESWGERIIDLDAGVIYSIIKNGKLSEKDAVATIALNLEAVMNSERQRLRKEVENMRNVEEKAGLWNVGFIDACNSVLSLLGEEK